MYLPQQSQKVRASSRHDLNSRALIQGTAPVLWKALEEHIKRLQLKQLHTFEFQLPQSVMPRKLQPESCRLSHPAALAALGRPGKADQQPPTGSSILPLYSTQFGTESPQANVARLTSSRFKTNCTKLYLQPRPGQHTNGGALNLQTHVIEAWKPMRMSVLLNGILVESMAHNQPRP